MDTLIICRSSQKNPRDFINMLAEGEGCNVSVLTEDSEGRGLLDDSVSVYEHQLNSIPPTSFIFPPDYHKYEEIISEVNPDIILLMGVTDLIFLPLSLEESPHLVLVPQGGELSRATNTAHWTDSRLKGIYYSYIYQPLFRRLLNRVDEVWGINEENKKIFQGLGLDENKFLPFDWVSADTETFNPEVDSIEFGTKEDVVIGSFRRVRGDSLKPSYRCFFEAMNILRQSKGNYHFVLGGIYEDGRSEEIVSMINEYNLEDESTKVELVEKSELPKYYSGIDIYVNFMWKNLPLTAIGTGAKEAMACGAFPVFFHDRSKGYVVEDGPPGLRVPLEPEAIADTLSQLSRDYNILKKQKQSVRKYAVNNYSRTVIRRDIFRRCQNLAG